LGGLERYLRELCAVLGEVPIEQVNEMVDVLLSANYVGSTIFVVGNGGSAATASHFACDLAKGTITPGRPRFRVMALTDNIPQITAWSNDVAYEEIFAEQLHGLMRRGDVLVAISGSGDSPNVLNAVNMACRRGGITVGLAGFEGGRLGALVDVPVIVPCSCMEQIEDAHLAVCHMTCSMLRQHLRQIEPPLSMMLDTGVTRKDESLIAVAESFLSWDHNGEF